MMLEPEYVHVQVDGRDLIDDRAFCEILVTTLA